MIKNKYCINPLVGSKVDSTLYYVLDIETFSYMDVQLPYAISYKGEGPIKTFHLYDYLVSSEVVTASNTMMITALKSLMLSSTGKIYVYTHNLGTFDGYFLFKVFLKMCDRCEDIKILKDDGDSFIEIRFNNIILRDSLRLFPASLKQLGLLCSLPIAKLPFNYRVNLDTLKCSTFKRESSLYISNDVEMLYLIIKKFKEEILLTYGVRLKDVYSTSSLAFRVFRTKFLNTPIPVSNFNEFNMAKRAYFGGAVNIYENYGENMYYYDVNSLYPYCMLKTLPLKYLRTVTTSVDKIEEVFGFITCKIEIDATAPRLVPVRHDGHIIFPYGTIYGTFFSEEVKSWVKYGYSITIISVYEYSKGVNIFDSYINKFYGMKSDTALKDKRFINKLMLNGLYGYLGRKYKNVESKVMKNTDIDFNNNNILTVKDLDDNYSIVEQLPIGKENMPLLNTSIAAAIASYGRIHMHKFLTLSDNPVIYSDTDSVVLKKPLTEGVSENIGDLKLEYTIKKGYFLKPKVYGFITDKGEEIIKTAGYAKDLITFKDIEDYYHKNTSKHFKTLKFFKSLTGLDLVFDVGDISIPKHYINMKSLNDKQPYTSLT